jgi:glutaredoxin 2
MSRPKKQDNTARYLLSARVDARIKNFLRMIASISDKNEHIIIEEALWDYVLKNWSLISSIKIPEDIKKKIKKGEDV